VRAFLAELYRRDRSLTLTGALHLALAVVFLAAMPFDERTILGASPWVKPLKFAVSVAVYLLSLSWLVGYARKQAPRAAAWISRGVSFAMLVEITGIALQSLRGVPSHFNHRTPLDEAIFNAMGLMIAFNTLLLVLLLAVLLRRQPGIPRAELLGIRLGIVLLLLASLVGSLMISADAHSVGGPDGGPGLPLVGWSTEHGDLRPAHALGLHALQALPLVGWWVARWRAPLAERARTAAVAAFAALYFSAFCALLLQAMAGHPLLAR
jgi:hypothetical protein